MLYKTRDNEAVSQNLTIEQGATFSFAVTWFASDGVTPRDLTGYTARMQVRDSYDAVSFHVELTTENGRIAITPAEGKVALTISATDTAALDFSAGVYDLELVDVSGVVTRLMEGGVAFSPEVTR